MAIHQNPSELSAEAIGEYIELARIGLEFKKPDGGCSGIPARFLLFCVIDALSNHLGFEAHSFGAMNHAIFGLNLDDDQIENLKVWYRHLLAHNGMIAPGTVLTPEPEGQAIEVVNGEPVVIRVMPLFRIVEQAWKTFDKATMKPRRTKKPKTPIDFAAASPIFPVASSGCPTIPKVRKI